jgi:hypothetical protein
MRGPIRRSCFAAVVALLCFAPGALAQARVTSPVTAPSFTSSVGMLVFNPISDDWNRKEKEKKRVAASEGGSAALYLLFTGLACGGAVLLRSRRTIGAKSV